MIPYHLSTTTTCCQKCGKELVSIGYRLFEGLELGGMGAFLLTGSVVSRTFCTERSFASFLHIALPRYVQRCQGYFAVLGHSCRIFSWTRSDFSASYIKQLMILLVSSSFPTLHLI